MYLPDIPTYLCTYRRLSELSIHSPSNSPSLLFVYPSACNSVNLSIHSLDWSCFEGHPPGVYTCSTKLQLHRSYDVSLASECLKENPHGIHHLNVGYQLHWGSNFQLTRLLNLSGCTQPHPHHTTPRSLQTSTLHPSYWQCQQGRSIGHTQIFQGWLHPSSCPPPESLDEYEINSPRDVNLQTWSQFGLFFLWYIYILYIYIYIYI